MRRAGRGRGGDARHGDDDADEDGAKAVGEGGHEEEREGVVEKREEGARWYIVQRRDDCIQGTEGDDDELCIDGGQL